MAFRSVAQDKSKPTQIGWLILKMEDTYTATIVIRLELRSQVRQYLGPLYISKEFMNQAFMNQGLSFWHCQNRDTRAKGEAEMRAQDSIYVLHRAINRTNDNRITTNAITKEQSTLPSSVCPVNYCAVRTLVK